MHPKKREINHISYGINEITQNLAVFTVTQIEDGLHEILNLSPNALCYVEGHLVVDKNNFVLGSGVNCFFWREFGFKGSGFDEKDLSERQIAALEMIAMRLEGMTAHLIAAIESNTSGLVRIADHFDPPKRAIVTSLYVAERLGRTIRWIGELARTGQIPKSCICPRSGDGKYWRFWRDKIDEWIETQAPK